MKSRNLIASVMCLCVSSLVAQPDRANVKGTVTGAKGPVANATVKVTSTRTGLIRQTQTGEKGEYTLPGLPIGHYTGTVEHEGDKTATMPDIELSIGQTLALDVALGAAESTEAAAAASEPGAEDLVKPMATPLDTSSAQLGMVVAGDQIRNIPLNGRDWSSLMSLAPGAINLGDGTIQSTRFFGHARDDNNWTLDGIDATGIKDKKTGVRLVVSTDAIAEFRVNSALYSAESGTNSAAQINLVSNSGGNRFHGGAFEFFRNSRLDARNPFDSGELPPFRLNQFGGSVGGPIVKNRTFFFANYEALRQRLSQSQIVFVPSPALRARAASASPELEAVVAAYGAGQTATRDPNVNQLSFEGKQAWREDSGLFRIDHRVSDNTTLFFRYNQDDARASGPSADRAVVIATGPLDKTVSRSFPSNYAAQIVHVFNQNTINETKAGVNRYTYRSQTGAPFLTSFSIGGLSSIGGADASAEAGTTYSIIDNLSTTHGRHWLKAGFEVRRLHFNSSDSASAAVSFSSVDDLLRNRVNSASINGPLPMLGARRTYYLGFIHDEFHVRPNLTLNFGVRYEDYGVISEVAGRARVFDPHPETCNGFCPAGARFYSPERNNFDPRVGVVWAPGGLRGMTALRAGFGVYHGADRFQDADAPTSNYADRLSIVSRDVPALGYPLTPFLSAALLTPRGEDQKHRDPYTEQWSVSIQRQLPQSFVAQAGYIGSSSHRLYSVALLNLIDAGTGVRPLPRYGQISEVQNYGNSNFEGLQFSLQRPFVRGWLWGAQYMWSHAIDDISTGAGEQTTAQNAACARCERASSRFDVRHTLTLNSVYDLPFGPGQRYWKTAGLAGKITGGWVLSGTSLVRSGHPLNVTVSRRSADLPDGNSRNQRPNLVPGVSLIPAGGATPDLWLNPAAFAVPAAGTWGNAGRNIGIGPGTWQVDLALTKRNRIGERSSLDFRVEAFNAFNHPQWGDPSTNISTIASFGRITTTLNPGATGSGSERQIQLMLRFSF